MSARVQSTLWRQIHVASGLNTPNCPTSLIKIMEGVGQGEHLQICGFIYLILGKTTKRQHMEGKCKDAHLGYHVASS